MIDVTLNDNRTLLILETLVGSEIHTFIISVRSRYDESLKPKTRKYKQKFSPR